MKGLGARGPGPSGGGGASCGMKSSIVRMMLSHKLGFFAFPTSALAGLDLKGQPAGDISEEWEEELEAMEAIYAADADLVNQSPPLPLWFGLNIATCHGGWSYKVTTPL